MAQQTCIFCGGQLAPAVGRPRSTYARPGVYRIERCRDCGAGATIPRPSAEELALCYGAHYAYSVHALIEVEKRRRSAAILDWSSVKTGRILDVGCMFGFLIDEARRRGLMPVGIELSPVAAQVAVDKGHHVFTGTLEEFATTHQALRFSAIFVQHVLEHIPDPHGFVATAKQTLEPGGKLVICVPNFEARLRRLLPSSWGWYQVPVHLHHFSARALRRLMLGAGLEVESQLTRGGDTLFLALCMMQVLRMEIGVTARNAKRGLTKVALRILGEVMRPYYALGDDELGIIARA